MTNEHKTEHKTAPKSPDPTSTPDVFSEAVNFVLAAEIEGGYVNDPRDPGGETNFGISKRSYPNLNIKALTREDAIAIYRRDYWDAVRGDELPPMIAVAVFDAAVNHGPKTAAQLLQRAARVEVDGNIGPKTMAAAHRAAQGELLLEFLGWRARRYHGTNGADTFIRGWMIRLFRLHLFATTVIGERGMAA